MLLNSAGLYFKVEYKERVECLFSYLAGCHNTFYQINHNVLLFKMILFPCNNDNKPLLNENCIPETMLSAFMY